MTKSLFKQKDGSLWERVAKSKPEEVELRKEGFLPIEELHPDPAKFKEKVNQ